MGNETWIGAGATVSNNVSICSDCMIGAGTVIVKNVDSVRSYMGVPASKFNKRNGVKRWR